METEKLLRQLETKEIVIFGTGFVAEMFWQALELHHVAERVRYCLVSDNAAERRQFHGKPIYALGQIVCPPDAVICLAVHEALAAELTPVLSKRLCGGVIWVYPHLYELIYGSPLKRGERMPLATLLRRQAAQNNWITVRYAAVRDYLRHDPRYTQSKDIYIRAMAIHCDPITARKRLRSLERLAGSVAERGLEPDKPLLIDCSGRIIDGLHRTALACFLQIKVVPCDVAAVSDVYDRLLNDKNRLPEQTLLQAGFTEADMQLLRQAKHELMKMIE